VAQLRAAVAGAPSEAGAAITALGAIQHPSATAALVELGRAAGAAGAAPWLVEWFEVAARGDRPELVAVAGELQGQYAAARDGGDILAGWRMTLEGGAARRGERVFREHPATTCTKCHALGAQLGSEAGPALDGVADRLTPEELLRSIVDPNAALAEGFQNWLLRTQDEEVFVGRIVEETLERLVLENNLRERLEFEPNEIALRKRDVSAMPADTASHLSRREMRDLLAFLRGLRAK
jgi:putative heme-binding domain-containing protein